MNHPDLLIPNKGNSTIGLTLSNLTKPNNDYLDDLVEKEKNSGTPVSSADNVLENKPKTFYQKIGKRIFDVAVAGLLIVPASWIIIPSALAVVYEDMVKNREFHNPFLFQKRVVKRDKTSLIVKIRSMCYDAGNPEVIDDAIIFAARKVLDKKDISYDLGMGAKELVKLLEDQGLYSNGKVIDYSKLFETLKKEYGVGGDKRVTCVGKIIRKFKIDELTQLYNVIIGNMSLVGPRPPSPGEVEGLKSQGMDIPPYVKTGITCLAQLLEHSISSEEKINKDHEYAQNITFLGDLKILYQTVDLLTRYFRPNKEKERATKSNLIVAYA